MTDYDVSIIGAGLAGLTAGLYLANKGLRVLILEKREEPGGLCGITHSNGYDFVIGCNDFGASLANTMQELGVDIKFKKSNTLFYFEHGNYKMPFNFSTLLKFIPYTFDIFRLARFFRNINNSPTDLNTLTSKYVSNSCFSEFLKTISYMCGVAPGDLSTEVMETEFSKKYNYGYQQPIVPIGGPKELVNKMLQRFLALGGTLKLNTSYEGVINENDVKKLQVNNETYTSKYVISSEGRWHAYPSYLKQGLAISTFHVALKKSFLYPKDIHAIAYFPADISSWMTKLDTGIMPAELGFHFFCSDLPERNDHYTINIYCYFPRGMDDPSQAQITHVQDYIFNKIEQLVPGFQNAILYKEFVSPKAFSQRYDGLSSIHTPLILGLDDQKVDSYDSQKDIYYVGNSVYPPGCHAGAAILSAQYAAKEIIQLWEARGTIPNSTIMPPKHNLLVDEL